MDKLKEPKRKIRELLDEGVTELTIVDCIDCYFGQHYITLWESALKALSVEGVLVNTGEFRRFFTLYALPCPKEEPSVAPVYKVVTEREEGFTSVWQKVGSLTYSIGQVTTDTSGGVSCWPTLETAVAHAKSSLGLSIHKPTTVLECYPIGCVPEPEDRLESSNIVRQNGGLKVKAVYVVKKVWPSEEVEPAPEPPKEEWVDVTKECTVKLYSVYGYYWAQVEHGGYPRLLLGKKPTHWAVEGGRNSPESEDYKVEFDTNLDSAYEGFKILHKVTK
ncbi:MAG: hypothetical protein ACXABY_05170 [Candidatus Thorarchaeota archaeon]|jgi:hypothetical protein